jgi:predicted transcriptional regulator
MIQSPSAKTEFSRSRRDSTRVIFEILLQAVGGASKTQIIFKVNLSFQLAERYVQFLLNRGLLKREIGPDGFTKYSLTEKGVGLLRLLREVESELSDLYIRTPSTGTGVPGPI